MGQAGITSIYFHLYSVFLNDYSHIRACREEIPRVLTGLLHGLYVRYHLQGNQIMVFPQLNS